MTHLLPRATPAEHGVPAASIRELVRRLDALDAVHSLMVLRHGHVVAEGWWAPYSAERPHIMFSVSKSFTSMAVGLAIDEGRFGLDDRVVDLLPDRLPPEPGELLGRQTMRHLLTMTTGHAVDSVSLARQDDETADWVAAILAAPVEFEPGERFVYDSGATHLLSAIVQRATGERLLDYLTPRLLTPLGIEGATWEQSPTGVDAGGWGLSITTEQLAVFGELVRRRGVWNDARLVPAEWIDAATSAQVPNDGPGREGEPPDWAQGYGFQFWRCRNGAYRGDGAFGQFVVVLPQHDAVLAITGGLWDMQAVLDAVWATLLPAFDAPDDGDEASESAALERELGALVLPVQPGEADAPAADRLLGADFDADGSVLGIRSVRVDAAPDGGWTLRLRTDAGEHVLPVGSGAWAAGESALFGAPAPASSSGAWIDGGFVTRSWWTATPWLLIAEFAPDGDDLVVRLRQNVSFGDTELGELRAVRRDA